MEITAKAEVVRTEFPKLKEFYVDDMSSLVKWKELNQVPNVKAFSHLECLILFRVKN